MDFHAPPFLSQNRVASCKLLWRPPDPIFCDFQFITTSFDSGCMERQGAQDALTVTRATTHVLRARAQRARNIVCKTLKTNHFQMITRFSNASLCCPWTRSQYSGLSFTFHLLNWHGGIMRRCGTHSMARSSSPEPFQGTGPGLTDTESPGDHICSPEAPRRAPPPTSQSLMRITPCIR